MGAERYTQKTLEALQTAQQTAALHYHQEITSAHLLLALVKEPEGLLQTIFEEAGTDLAMLRARMEQLLRKIPSVKGQDRLTMGVDTARVMAKAEAEAARMKDDFVSTEHLLLGIIADGSDEVKAACREFGLTKGKVESSVKKNRKQNVTSDHPEDGYKSLEKYGRDLTAAARAGKLDPVIG
ncbi:MAG: ATP-dependent chaperone ClpB, partial [Schwartzia sp.]|nr:ATP-dependent chaperone ClpB [Schwartzia sp. (in: firmicutes)]